MSQSESEHELKHEKVSETAVHFHVGDREYHVHIDRTYRLHGHFGEFTSLEQVEEVIRKIEADR